MKKKNAEEIAAIQRAGTFVAKFLRLLQSKDLSGVSSMDLDLEAAGFCRREGVQPAFKGWNGFPAHLCVSINHELCHGLPNREKVLHSGDLVSFDFGVLCEGWYADSAITLGVGEVNPRLSALIQLTEEALSKGIQAFQLGGYLLDIGAAIQEHVQAGGGSVIPQFAGHGIGRELHEDPKVPNLGPKGRGIPLEEGMVLAIEPIITFGQVQTVVGSDPWSIFTQDQSPTAHFEHTVALTSKGPQVLTAR